MKRANHLGLMAAALGLFAGCSGTYYVGSDLANAGAPGQAGGPASLPGASSGAGGSGGSSPASGGNDAVAGGAGNGTGSPTYCGYELPTASSVEFAPPAVVYQRVFKFLFDLDELPPTTLPSETTRAWAGDLAATALASLSTPSAKGMERFMRNWWTGTPTPELWAEYFSSRHGTLVDLLTTDSLLPNGAGLLTDPAVLDTDRISTRGVFVLEHVTDMGVPPPDPTSNTPPPPLPGQTRRTRLDTLVAAQPCQGCHVLIDPFGHALENFASDGSIRTLDNGLPIDTAAAPRLPHSGKWAVLDAHDLGTTLANSCDVALSLSRRLLQDARVSAQLPGGASDAGAALVAAQFTASGLSLPELVRLVVESDTFLSAD